MQARRVVTGHHANGKAIVLSDAVLVSPPYPAPGVEILPLWSTAGFPVDNSGNKDARDDFGGGMTRPNGTIFTLVSFQPGNAPLPHRTSSIDYGIILSGEVDMELDAGQWLHLTAGDVLVQRGTVHNWINRGAQPCVLAAIIIDAKPVQTRDGKVLEATA